MQQDLGNPVFCFQSQMSNALATDERRRHDTILTPMRYRGSAARAPPGAVGIGCKVTDPQHRSVEI
jgi:hypothetical protein